LVGIVAADCLEVGDKQGQVSSTQRRRGRRERRERKSLAGKIGFADFFAEIRGVDFDGAAHFVEATADAHADALGERVFTIGGDGFAAGETETGA